MCLFGMTLLCLGWFVLVWDEATVFGTMCIWDGATVFGTACVGLELLFLGWSCCVYKSVFWFGRVCFGWVRYRAAVFGTVCLYGTESPCL